MANLDPSELFDRVEERYASYLKTTFYFRDPELRRSFEEELRKGQVSSGPFIEATPAFERSAVTAELFRELLGTEPDPGFLQAVKGQRRLFWHQEQAIRLAAKGVNVVVATGTGSGKTESFLYSILGDLYREHLAGTLARPGVRALILYPMNALAYDQRDRLREIAFKLEQAGSEFRFTFGQYIGDTPESEGDSSRSAQARLAEANSPSELLLRDQMRATPPHILLTNYSMLEYLLVRPDDFPLFDKSTLTWRFLVIDEAHQYRGSKGCEMAMLLRRLKSRLRPSGSDPTFRCIATSATLTGSGDDSGAVARFASELFGEPFSEASVITGRTTHIERVASRLLGADAYRAVSAVLDSGVANEAVVSVAEQLGLSATCGDPLGDILWSMLLRDKRAEGLRVSLSEERTRPVSELAQETFPELESSEARELLGLLIRLLTRANDPQTGDPMLSARYHYLLRSLEGAFISLHPTKQVRLTRPGASPGTHWFEVALCRQCGQHYFVGRELAGHLVEASRDPGDLEAKVTFYRPVPEAEDGETGEEEESNRSRYRLCIECGSLTPVGEGEACSCSHTNWVMVEEQESSPESFDQIPRCTACGYPAQDPVREMLHGTDGPHAVIATTLCEALPEDRRRVLAFADSRQDAAFFAWYLEDSYGSLRTRTLALKALSEMGHFAEQGVSLGDLASALTRLYREREIVPKSTSPLGLARRAWADVYREFLSEEPRLSLSGVGLVRWSCAWMDDLEPPAFLLAHPWELSEEEARALLRVLIDMARADGAFELRAESGVTVTWQELGFSRSQRRLRLGPRAKQHDVASWDSQRGRRVQYLAKCLAAVSGIRGDLCLSIAVDTARRVWQWLKERDERVAKDSRLLIPSGDGQRLNPDWWRAIPIPAGAAVPICATCGQVQDSPVRGVCSRHRCRGTVVDQPGELLDENHYRTLYRTLSGNRLHSEEHTAQLSREKARVVQSEFKEGRIDLLSSSTTFELGVDLGILDVVFLRNMPPEPFNYVQRVGRAGRRSGHPGIAVTFCRRSPHDLYHFAHPERMLRGISGLPGLTLHNAQIAQRHLVAMVLADFFRDNPDRFSSVAAFCGSMDSPTIVSDVHTYAARNRERLTEALKATFPPDLHVPLGLAGGGDWLRLVCSSDSRLAKMVAGASSDYRALVALLRESSTNSDIHKCDFDKAKWAKGRLNHLSSEDVITFLSRCAIIPKYGFPVDVVELDLQAVASAESDGVLLQRDLSVAIAEFAPSCTVIANKKAWRSVAVKFVPEHEVERYGYRVCPKHGAFVAWKKEKPAQSLPCGCKRPEREFIVPSFGFVGDHQASTPRRRPARLFTTRPYFLGLLDAQPDLRKHGPVTFTPASPGTMAVICEGRHGEGFHICPVCGAGSASPRQNVKPSHIDSRGRQCSGRPDPVSLGQVFDTDVVRLDFPTSPFTIEADGRPDIWFARSLSYALLEGAAASLGVPSTDLNVTLQVSKEEPFPGIVIYDNVPGGAGLVARLEDPREFRAMLTAARERVSGACGCGHDTSCYGCLRSYRNQFAHQRLKRGPVADYLGWILDTWNED